MAGESEALSYAAHLGIHIRTLDQSEVPQAPRGSEAAFGAAAGAHILLGGASLLIGPEIRGATALRAAFLSDTTALEALAAAALDPVARVRVKLGLGFGLHSRFGAPHWRAVAGLELH